MSLPDPLVPADVDLRGFEFMPLFGDRLFKSETWISASADAKVAALRLWWHSYGHEVPAGSLPDNDGLLAEYAGYGVMVKAWKKLKAQAMRGFVLCSDGRWYHPLIAELAIDGWKERVRNREKQRAWRERNQSKDRNVTVTETVTQPGTKPLCHAGEGEGEGKGEVISKPTPLQPASTTPTGVAPPDPPQARASPSPAASLSKALRAEGVDSQPADPRLIAMAEQGVTAETLQAAAAEAKRAKPGERIPVGYVIGIVERWAKDAAAVATSGATKPGAKMGGRQAAISNYAAQAAAARGESNERAASSERDITGESVRIA